MKATGGPPLGVAASKVTAIQVLVARMFSLQPEELSTSRRVRSVTIPRQIAMYLAKRETDASLAEIGNLFGGKHHSTVLHAVLRIEELRHTDSATDLAITILQKNLNSS
jgi:chromosomal replication initiator protein